MRIIIFLVFLFTLVYGFVQTSYSQTKIGVSLLYNSYELEEVKRNQKNALSQLPFDAKIVEQFPNFWGVRGKLLFPVNYILNLGFSSFYTSTGGRISYGDITGSYLLDQNLSLLGLGLTIEALVHEDGNFKAFSGMIVSGDFSKQIINSSLIIYPDINETSTIDLKSIGVSLWPYLSGEINVVAKLSLYVNLGYQINIYEGKFKNSTITTNSGPNWTGFRPELGIGYAFDSK